MKDMFTSAEPLLRLMHLASPALPIGGFTYSQGIEWAVEAGWIRTAEDLEAWLRDQLRGAITQLDLPLLARAQAAGFAFAACAWEISAREALIGYAWAWLENLVLAAVKLVPLGQTRGQRLLACLIPEVPALVEAALTLQDGEIGAASPALAIASSAHETQYSRLFRS